MTGEGNKYINYNNVGLQLVYKNEMNKNGNTYPYSKWKVISSKLSLMYASDYALALGSQVFTNTSDSYYETLKTGWIHLSNNDIDANGDGFEWTMARYGYANGRNLSSSISSYASWLIDSWGDLYFDTTAFASAIRPVFYLINDIEMIGKGTLNSPYIIK